MRKERGLFLWITSLLLSHTVVAQWTEKDSVWLQKVLSGEEDIRLTPETQKAIQSGSFLESHKPDLKLLSVPPDLPIQKDFSEMINQGLKKLTIDEDSVLSPSFFKLSPFKYDTLPSINRFNLSEKSPWEKEYFYLYHIPTEKWILLGNYEPLARAGAGVVLSGNTLYYINGELKPGVRTPSATNLF